MNPTTTLTLIDGVRVVVPDSLDQITPYVLREQQDWSEDEIKFIRRVVLPGQKATLDRKALDAAQQAAVRSKPT